MRPCIDFAPKSKSLQAQGEKLERYITKHDTNELDSLRVDAAGVRSAIEDRFC